MKTLRIWDRIFTDIYRFESSQSSIIEKLMRPRIIRVYVKG